MTDERRGIARGEVLLEQPGEIDIEEDVGVVDDEWTPRQHRLCVLERAAGSEDGILGEETMRSLQGDAAAQARRRSAFQCRLIPIFPSHTGASLFRMHSMIGVPRIGKSGLGR
jgi:hypothetical protein